MSAALLVLAYIVTLLHTIREYNPRPAVAYSAAAIVATLVAGVVALEVLS